MSSRVSRLSESSSEGEDPIPPPPPPKPVVISKPKGGKSVPTPTPAPGPSLDIDGKPIDVLIAKADQLDKKYNKRFTMEDPGYNEMVTNEQLPPPCLPEYQGRSFRGGGGGGGRSYRR